MSLELDASSEQTGFKETIHDVPLMLSVFRHYAV